MKASAPLQRPREDLWWWWWCAHSPSDYLRQASQNLGKYSLYANLYPSPPSKSRALPLLPRVWHHAMRVPDSTWTRAVVGAPNQQAPHAPQASYTMHRTGTGLLEGVVALPLAHSSATLRPAL